MSNKLKLEPSAFIGELQKIVGTGKIGWSAEDHAKLVEAVTNRLQDQAGQPMKLDQESSDILALVFRQNKENQVKVLNATLAKAGYELDAVAEEALTFLFSQSSVADILSKEISDETGKPMVVKEKRKKTNVLASLRGKASPPTATKSEVPA